MEISQKKLQKTIEALLKIELETGSIITESYLEDRARVIAKTLSELITETLSI
jgi:hypothetical protein